ncbi:MAG: TolC family protein [Planctomycetota bacterium]
MGSAWLDWAIAEKRRQVAAAYLERIAQLTPQVARWADLGEVARSKPISFALAQPAAEVELQTQRDQIAQSRRHLIAAMGLAPVASPAFASDPAEPVADFALAEEPLEVRRLRLAYELREQRLRQAILGQYPDLSVGPALESDGGQFRLGVLGGFPIPLWNRNRQAIAVAEAERTLARAEFERGCKQAESHRADLAALRITLEQRGNELAQRVRPLTTSLVEQAVRQVRIGEASPLVLLEALSRQYAVEMQILDTRAAWSAVEIEWQRVHSPMPAEEPQTNQ